MSKLNMHESHAVAVARAHVEAWSNLDYETARRSLAEDVHVTVTTTQPMMPSTDTIGVDKYMDGADQARTAGRAEKRSHIRVHR